LTQYIKNRRIIITLNAAKIVCKTDNISSHPANRIILLMKFWHIRLADFMTTGSETPIPYVKTENFSQSAPMA
jgi:hypothetical protein